MGSCNIDLQAEPFKVIDAFFEEYGNCVINGCGVLDWEDGTYHVEPGLVGLQGTDPEGNRTYKVAPFAGVTAVSLPAYMVLRFDVAQREYVDEKMHPIYYEYRAELVPERPADEPYLEITPSGAACFLDVTGVTHKLDKDGDGKDVVVSFKEAEERTNVESGDTLSGLWGKVRKWFAGLQAVAFSGKTEDLTDDAEHRLTTDTEKARWDDTYTKQETDSKDAEALRIAKEYADNQVSNLGSDVYRKAEVYTKQEADAQHEVDLAAAKKFATDRISELINGSPAALDTLYEIANALNNDPNFATTIMALINGKADTAHKHTKSQITDFPTSMPASDVYPWAKASSKPTYTASEVGAAAAGHNHDSAYQPKGSYAAASHSHTKSQITDFPTSMPASDVYAWAKASSKPTYTASEVGAATAGHNHDSAYAAKNHTHSGVVTFHSRYLCGGQSSAGTCTRQAGTTWASGRCTRTDAGNYTITHNLGTSNYIVILNGQKNYSHESRGIYVTLLSRSTTSITVRLADDDSPNDGLFYVDILLY